MKIFKSNKLLWAGLFSILAIIGVLIIYNAPHVSIPACIEIVPGHKTVTLGYKQLGQRKGPLSADTAHLKIEKKNGLHTISNVSQGKRIELKNHLDKSRYVKRWRLQTGDTFILNDHKFQVIQADQSEYLSLLHVKTKRTAKWKNGYLKVSDPFLYTEARSLRWRIQKRIRWWMRSLSDYWEKEMHLFSLGGGVNTPDRWQINGLKSKYAHISWYKNHFYLMPGKHSRLIQMSRKSQKQMDNFSQIQEPLNQPNNSVRQLIIGKTYYHVDSTDTHIYLKPFRNTDAFFENETLTEKEKAVSIHYNPEYFIGSGSMTGLTILKKIGLRLSIILITALILFILIQMKFPKSNRTELTLMTVPSVILTGVSIICWPIHHGLDLSYCLLFAWLSWGWSTFWLMVQGRLTGINQKIWACAIILAGMGALTLTQLAIGADNIKWLDYPRKHLLVLSMFGWFFPVVTLIPLKFIGRVFVSEDPEYKVIRLGIVSIIMFILIYHFFKGSEQGLGVFQPSELAKFLFIVVGAVTGMHLFELRIYDAEFLADNPIKVVWSFINTFIFILCIALFVFLSVRDMSPIVISFIFLLCGIWKIAPHPEINHRTLIEYLCRGFVVMICIIIGGLVILAYYSPEYLPENMPQKDRILVWSKPSLYPHSGWQVIKSMTISGLGRWIGATDSWFGNNHAAMTVPMIQNDFIGAFIIYRWGGLVAILLLITQLLYISSSLKIAKKIETNSNSGYEMRRMNQIFSLIIYGFVWMTAIQWFISWSNVLGLFPVMGQPMTWISQANSHLIFFALPSLAFVMLAGKNVNVAGLRKFPEID